MNGRTKAFLLRLRWDLLHFDPQRPRRQLYKALRPASYPYISGDGFRRLAKHVLDETHQSISPEGIREGDVVFVSTDYAGRFLEEIDPKIRAQYRLITHNSDLAADEALISHLSGRIITWFAQNNTFYSERVVPLPIGLENLHHYHAGIPRNFTALRAQLGMKQNRILGGFTIATNARERQTAFDVAAQTPTVDWVSGWPSQKEYMRILAGFKFVLSPPGNGLDTHRTWEAMYLGVVPIVKDSVATRSFEALGLPLWIISSWETLLAMREGDLAAKYDSLSARFASPALFMDYWRARIVGSEPPTADAGPKHRSPNSS